MQLHRAILAALALALAALSPAHATAEHDYAKGEYAIITSPDFSHHLTECCDKLCSPIPQPAPIIWA